MNENSEPSGDRHFTASPHETAIGEPVAAFRALLENGKVSRWRLGLGFLLHSAMVSVLLLLPVLTTERLNGGALPLKEPISVPAAPPRGKPEIQPQGEQSAPIPPRPTAIDHLFIPVQPPHPVRPEGGTAPVIQAGPGSETGGWAVPGAPTGTGTGVPWSWGTQPSGPSVPPPVTGDAPIRLSKGVDPPRLLRRVEPVYPSIARMAGIQGTVVLDGVLGTDGRVRQIEVKAGPVLLRRAAREAVEQWLYQPAHLNNQPVAVFFRIEVKFVLNR
ncbi:MAG: TonB family protein [Acidobacteria bacterium]|nr:TonB family protein [Acidobacteriota bacterium]